MADPPARTVVMPPRSGLVPPTLARKRGIPDVPAPSRHRGMDLGAALCRRQLVVDGAVRICWGPITAAYVRVGHAGVFVRAGTVCRHCGHFRPEGGAPFGRLPRGHAGRRMMLAQS